MSGLVSGLPKSVVNRILMPFQRFPDLRCVPLRDSVLANGNRAN